MTESKDRPLLERAATAFGLEVAELVALGGATGQVFASGDVVVRVGENFLITKELVAVAAVAGVLPTPEILDHVEFADGSAVLIRRVDGTTAADFPDDDLARAERRGRACGRIHPLLGAIEAPPAIPVVSPAPGQGQPLRLLHLDLHPFNILLDDDDEVAAVIDWSNCAAGPAEYDLARSQTILTLDPSARQAAADPRFRAFCYGWRSEAGLDRLSPASIAWACRFMLRDLRGRYKAAELAPVVETLAAAEAAAATGP